MDEVILQGLTEVFRQVFDDAGLVLTPQTASNDVPGWDSFSHINLMVSVERRFKVKFSDKEIAGFKNVGELAAAVAQKSTDR